MSVLEQQLHGYRHGHQLLSASMSLPKSDQALVDRLSDIAGPLSPGEQFDPYLTCYPLPGGSHYVIARTWQDLDAPRAGCVRTRSLIVPMSEWVGAVNIVGLIRAATGAGPSAPANAPVNVDVSIPEPLPPVDAQKSTELLEAIFLEDREPIVVFDAEQSELIAVRLLTALWPGLRRNFSVSTFARSPRMIQKQSFDLVFAPKDSRSRFGDWKGRRIDGRKADKGRHRWSAAIVDKVFVSPTPSLRGLDSLGEMSTDAQGSEAALRISLLWDELQSKVDSSPNAALGLLDIANTRAIRNVEAIRALEPALARAARQATTTMPAKEAWRFLAAMSDKLRDQRLSPLVEASVRGTAVDLAASHAIDTVAILPDLMSGQRELLTGAAGDGISRALDPDVANQLAGLGSENLFEVVMASAPLMRGLLTSYPEISKPLCVAFERADAVRRAEAQRLMLPLLVNGQHVNLASVMFEYLDKAALAEEVQYLHKVNRLKSSGLRELIVRRAERTGGVLEVRDAAAALGEESGATAIVEALIKPIPGDLLWLLSEPRMSALRRLSMIADLIGRATKDQLRTMLSDQELLVPTMALLLGHVATMGNVLLKVLNHAQLSPGTFVDAAIRTLPHLDQQSASELAARAFEILLPRDLGESVSCALSELMTATAGRFNAAKAFQLGLHRGVPGAVVSRNLVVFNVSPPHIRKGLIDAVEVMAAVLVDRSRIDISLEAAVAAADLLWDAHQESWRAHLKASATMLPVLMRSIHEPVSPLIAAAFPPVYRELQQENLPDYMSFIFMFIDWDKRKSARRTLVEAFLRSNWRAIDMALAAVRAGDGVRILKRLSRGSGGERAIEAIASDLMEVPAPWQAQIKSALQSIRGDGSNLDEWDL